MRALTRGMQTDRGSTLVEVVVAVGIAAMSLATAGAFWLAGPNAAVATAMHEVSAAFDEARRTASAYDSATVVFIPAPGGGFSARIYRRSPGDPAFAPANGPTYDSTASAAETAAPLGQPGIAFAVDARGAVVGYAAFAPGASSFSSTPCPGSGAFVIALRSGPQSGSVTVPCALAPSGSTAVTLLTPPPAASPYVPPAPDIDCGSGTPCPLPTLIAATAPTLPPAPTPAPTTDPVTLGSSGAPSAAPSAPPTAATASSGPAFQQTFAVTGYTTAVCGNEPHTACSSGTFFSGYPAVTPTLPYAVDATHPLTVTATWATSLYSEFGVVLYPQVPDYMLLAVDPAGTTGYLALQGASGGPFFNIGGSVGPCAPPSVEDWVDGYGAGGGYGPGDPSPFPGLLSDGWSGATSTSVIESGSPAGEWYFSVVTDPLDVVTGAVSGCNGYSLAVTFTITQQ